MHSKRIVGSKVKSIKVGYYMMQEYVKSAPGNRSLPCRFRSTEEVAEMFMNDKWSISSTGKIEVEVVFFDKERVLETFMSGVCEECGRRFVRLLDAKSKFEEEEYCDDCLEYGVSSFDRYLRDDLIEEDELLPEDEEKVGKTNEAYLLQELENVKKCFDTLLQELKEIKKQLRTKGTKHAQKTVRRHKR